MPTGENNPRDGLLRTIAAVRAAGSMAAAAAVMLTLSYGQILPTPSGSATAAISAASIQPPPPAPIPLAEVVSQAGAVSARIQNLDVENASDPIAMSVGDQLPPLLKEIDKRSSETAKILEARPSLDTLRSLNSEWQRAGDELAGWKRELTARATVLDRLLVNLTQLSGTWNATLVEAGSRPAPEPKRTGAAAAPREIVALIQSTIEAIQQASERYASRRSEILSLQNRVAEQETRIASAKSAIERVRQETVNGLFVKDSSPVWSGQLYERAREHLLDDSRADLTEQLKVVASYARKQVPQFFAQGVIALLLIACLYWARPRIQPWLTDEPALIPVARIFDLPVATASVFTILISGWIHPQAPRLFSAFLGAAALIPTVVILRRLVERQLRPIFNALVVFYFVDLFLGIAVTLPLLARFLFLAEFAGGIAFMGWLIASGRLSPGGRIQSGGIWTTLRIGIFTALPLFIVAMLANALGYLSLAGMIGNAVLGGAYLAAILFAGVIIADGLLMFILRVPPLSLLGMVKHHRSLLHRRIHGALLWAASIVWILFELDRLSLRVPAAGYLISALTSPFGIGKLQLTLGAMLAFFLTIWAAFLLSRLVRFVLSEDVYPRAGLARGMPYAISTMLHYTILLVGFLAAVAALGVDMTHFTILAGAFGVGLGFGLQTIVNNFVSGIILLFEQPVKVGDVIQLGGRSGSLWHIGLRASIMRTAEGSEVIIPNAELISGEVTNWTLSDQQRRLDIAVGVDYNADPENVIAILLRVASSNPDVMTHPPPMALFMAFGDSALTFELRAWTSEFDHWPAVKSSLTIGINAALRDAGISIPYPQRDLHIHTVAAGLPPPVAGEKNEP